MATKRIKYLGINLPMGTKGLYAEKNKTLMKEIKDTMKQNSTADLVLLRSQYHPKWSTVSMQFLSKSQ